MREGRNFIETWSGNAVFLPDADVESIQIKDIAHALANVCRFAGHVDQFYSVAEHSINVAWIVPPEHRLQGLLHDATEAYICDIPTPFKRMLPEYADLEENLWRTIAERFNVPVELSPEVLHADRVMLMTERDALKSMRTRPWSPEYENTPRWPGFSARPTLHAGGNLAEMFLNHFYAYGGKD